MTPSELERLAILSEELGEIQQIIGKTIRHGYESFSPFDKNQTTNRKLLEKELGDAQWIVELMFKNKDINQGAVNLAACEKEERVEKYLHHN